MSANQAKEQLLKDKVLKVLDDSEIMKKLDLDRKKVYELKNRGQSNAKMLEFLWRADQIKFK